MSTLEQNIRSTGMQLYHSIESETPSIFKKDFWSGKVMDWCMQNEAFKVEMFRFVDVFPTLSSSESLARHLQEYFCRPDQRFPGALQKGLQLVSPNSLVAKMAAKTVAANITAMGKQFIVGVDASDALSTLKKLRKEGYAFTADLLGEAVVSESEAEDYFRRYLDLLQVLSQEQAKWPALGQSFLDWGSTPRINVSIKPSAMYSQFDPRGFTHSLEKAKERLRLICREAKRIGGFILLDMEQTTLKNITLALYKELMTEDEFKDYPHTGIVLQAYLKDTEQDLQDLLQWVKERGQRITVRLVKGAYWDAEVIWARQKNWDVPVFTNKHATDANYEKLARVLLENHDIVSYACASHNIRTISYVLETARELGVPREHYEFQALYGMAEPVRYALKKAGLKLRLYSPVGELIPGMAYLVRRLLENTANESFVRQTFAEGVAKERLLMNPLDLLAESQQGSETTIHAEETAEKTQDKFSNEPPLNWALSESRCGFTQALVTVRSGLGQSLPLYIGGKPIETNRKIVSVNPNRPTQVVAMVSAASLEDASLAVDAAAKAYPSWRSLSANERADYLLKAAAVARRRRMELAALQVYEVGKNWSEADGDVKEAIDFMEFYAREMLRLAPPQPMGYTPGELNHLMYEPRGIGAVIAPWNFPLAISTGMTAAALVTGNTVVYKPASQSPAIGHAMYQIFFEAGLPPGVLNFLPGPGAEIGDFLVRHPQIAFLAFTGSMEVGLRIIRLAAENPSDIFGVKQVIAEMGGKNAIIIDSDADLDEAVIQTLYSAFGYQGQKCSACSRVIVLAENYDIFTERLVEAAKSVIVGNPERPETFLGAVIDSAARDKILSFIELGKRDGRPLIIREEDHCEGYYAPLAIFEIDNPDHPLMQEEIFGPVLSVYKARDFDEALEVANGTRFALTGGLFSRSPNNIARARREFRVGNLYINRGITGAIVERHPFGGFKMSGVGSKTGGPDYLRQFMVPRSISENTMRRGFAPMEDGC